MFARFGARLIPGPRGDGPGLVILADHFADDDRTLHARVLRDLADWGLKRPEYDVDAGLDVFIVVAERQVDVS